MTNRQWAGITAALLATWPQAEIPERSLAKWKCDLDDLNPEHVLIAVQALADREFCPNGGQVRAEVIRLGLDAPDWATVRQELRRLGSVPVKEIRDGKLVPCEDGADEYQGVEAYPRADALAAAHPVIREYVSYVGWEEVQRMNGATKAGESIGAEAQAREKYLAFVARVKREEAIRGLPSAGLRELERVNSGPRRLDAGKLKQLVMPAE